MEAAGTKEAVLAHEKLGIAIAVAAWLVAAAVATPAQAQGSRLATLTQQKMCADQARKFFSEYESGTQKSRDVVPDSYIDHYDAKANVCYVAIVSESSDGEQTIINSTKVFDAFEQTSYALYIWKSARVKKAWEVKPLWCTVEPRGQREITCNSEDEFNELVEKYFGLVVQ